MKNITISLPDELARQARIEAAQAEKSVSRFVADLLKEKVGRTPRRQSLQLEAIERFLSGPDIEGFAKPGRPLRDHIYANFRGHEPDRVQPRPTKPRKAS